MDRDHYSEEYYQSQATAQHVLRELAFHMKKCEDQLYSLSPQDYAAVKQAVNMDVRNQVSRMHQRIRTALT